MQCFKAFIYLVVMPIVVAVIIPGVIIFTLIWMAESSKLSLGV